MGLSVEMAKMTDDELAVMRRIQHQLAARSQRHGRPVEQLAALDRQQRRRKRSEARRRGGGSRLGVLAGIRLLERGVIGFIPGAFEARQLVAREIAGDSGQPARP